jgi:hypothetical protein
MDALRVPRRIRLTPVFEWLVAAAFLAATIGVASLILGELRPAMPAGVAVPAQAASAPRPVISSIPPAVPARAVSVPVLPFVDGKEVKIGDTVAVVAERLGRSAEVGRQEVDRGALGERLTRFYEYSGSRFILVFEPFERSGEARIAAIYLP